MRRKTSDGKTQGMGDEGFPMTQEKDDKAMEGKAQILEFLK